MQGSTESSVEESRANFDQSIALRTNLQNAQNVSIKASVLLGTAMTGAIYLGITYFPAVAAAYSEYSVTIHFYATRFLNGRAKELFEALRYTLRNKLTPSQLQQLEKLANKFRDAKKFVEELRKYRDLYKKVSDAMKNL